MVKTYKLKLYPPNKKKEDLLIDLTNRQNNCVNYFIDKIRELRTTSIKELQKHYFEARSKFGLSADLTQGATFTAIRIARRINKKITDTPYLKQKILTLNRLTIDKNNLGSTLGTGKRIWFPFKSRELPAGEIKESLIKRTDKDWYCFLSVEVSEPKLDKFKRCLGVDLGLAKVAVVSDWNGHHNLFFKGEPLRATRRHYYNLRKQLQPKIKQGNVYKLLKRISKKEHNWITDTNHKISRAIVNHAKKLKRSIVMENLTGITERLKFGKKTRRMIKTWAFRQLADFIKYKARLAGLQYVIVDPRETSKTCPKCGHVARNNRRSQERFICRRCEYESNADRIGAINIALRGTGVSA